MGIRLHKALGYGLADVVSGEHYRMDDPRINRESPLFDYNFDVDGYAEWLAEKYTEDDLDRPFMDFFWLNHRDEQPKREKSDCVVYSPEYGMSNVLLVQPLAESGWSRYNDAIDCAWEWQEHPNSDDHFEWVLSPLYPWTMWMDKETGETIREEPAFSMLWVLRTHVKPEHAKGPERLRYFPPDPDRPESDLDAFAKALKLEGIDWVRDHIVPIVPQEVRDLVEYGELFTDGTVWRQLRPMLYTYWG